MLNNVKYTVIAPSAGAITVIPIKPVPIITANNQTDIAGILADLRTDTL